MSSAWGGDGDGQLGDGTIATPSSQPLPRPLNGVPTLTAVAVGGTHSLGLKPDGTVVAWGDDGNGQLGNGAALTGSQATPTTVVGVGGSGTLGGVIAIAAGAYHSLALKSDGTVVAWGGDFSEQLGDGANDVDQPAPVLVHTVSGGGVLSGIVAIAAGGYHTLALKSDGTVVAWGRNEFGELGNGAITGLEPTPVAVVGVGGSGFLANVVAIAAGTVHSLALRSDGTVVAWGRDDDGQLGNGSASSANQATPVVVVGVGGGGALTSVVALSAGGAHNLALKSDGTVAAWGFNTFGQLGNGSTGSVDQPSPAIVAGVGGSGVLSNVTALAAGSVHSLALRADGTILAWGRDLRGQLGDNVTFIDQSTPALISALGGGAALAQGGEGQHSLVLAQGAPLSTVTVATTGTGGNAVARDLAGEGSGPFVYPIGSVVTLTPQPGAGQIFVGWTVDDANTGWASPLSLTITADHSIFANFAPLKAFGDVGSSRPDYTAITELASRGTIRGYANGSYGPDDGVQRAQMAALIARATLAGPGTPTNGILTPPACLAVGTWDCEDWGNGFTDPGGIDANLWRNAGALQHYAVALGYTAQDCAARGKVFPCYGPNDPVSYAQTVAFITRAMIAKGYWQPQPSASLPYAGVPSVLALEVRTYHHYTGGVPAAPADAAGWNAGATRGWFARTLWHALNAYWATDGTLPDGRNAGGFLP